MTEQAQSTRAIVEVTAGVVHNITEDEFTRRFALTSDEWESASNPGEVLATLNGKALGYSGLLMLQPERFNWVRTEWLWI